MTARVKHAALVVLALAFVIAIIAARVWFEVHFIRWACKP